ncbi:hypothetical protein F2Q69_00009856 [Brassica cretica]|uniref:DUF632 domain-containing protein n=3 Tax=Brassica TaxID=3705 RepID=A0A8S9PP05_BRACR|nr:hypothetical protein F2Q69_00009856 [Brassica cretica]
MRNLTVKQLAIDSQLNQSTRRIGFIPKGPCVDSLVLLIGELECLWIQVFSFVVDCGISQQTVPSVSSSTLPSNRVHWSRLDQTIETSFASSRIAYIQSLRNVSDALRARVQVQETSPDETYKAETYGAYSFLGTCCPYIQPPSPHNSQWDFFWNQFAPMDYNGYNYDNNQSEGQRAWEKLLRILKISLPPSICTSANEVSGLLEASKVQYAIYNDQLSAKKMLNPVALFSSTSSFSSSSRFLIISQSSSSDFSEESCMISGERVRIAYEKKRLVLRNHEAKRDDSSAVGKTRAIVRDLHTHLKVSIHSIESVSSRIESLRDQELLPQILKLLQGLARMWKVMAECHQIQKRTLEEAKLFVFQLEWACVFLAQVTSALLLAHLSCRSPSYVHKSPPAWCFSWNGPACSWPKSHQHCFWPICHAEAQAMFTLLLAATIPSNQHHKKINIESNSVRFKSCGSATNLESLLPSMDHLSEIICVVFNQLVKEESYSGRTERMELDEADKVEKLAEIAVKVVCHGMPVAVSSLAEFAITSDDELSKLVNHPEDATLEQHQEANRDVN